MRDSIVCPTCKGNGFLRGPSRDQIAQCETCKSSGEIRKEVKDVERDVSQSSSTPVSSTK